MLTLGRLRMTYRDQPAIKIDMLPALMEQLSAPHPGIERRDDDGAEMVRAGGEQFRFVRNTQHRTPLPPLTRHGYVLWDLQ